MSFPTKHISVFIHLFIHSLINLVDQSFNKLPLCFLWAFPLSTIENYIKQCTLKALTTHVVEKMRNGHTQQKYDIFISACHIAHGWSSVKATESESSEISGSRRVQPSKEKGTRGQEDLDQIQVDWGKGGYCPWRKLSEQQTEYTQCTEGKGLLNRQ